MQKKVYFIISSILTFLLSIYSIIMANTIVKNTLDSLKQIYSSFPENFQNRVIDTYQNSGVKIIIIFSLIVMISSIVLFVFSLNNTLLKHKGFVITLTLICFLFSDILLVQLINIASFIIILCCKRKNPEDFPDQNKKELPKLQLKKNKLTDYLLSILLLIVYFSQLIWSKYIPDEFVIRLTVEIIFNLMMILLCVLVFYDQLKFNFKKFKSNFKTYMRFIFTKLGIAYIFLFVASLISISITKNAISANQEAVESLPIYYILPTVIIYAPIVEEILFRGIIRRFIKNDILFIICSAFIFGILHTIGESSIVNILVMALPYSVLGAYLSYVYVKTNNILTSIAGHSIVNTISSIFLILT